MFFSIMALSIAIALGGVTRTTLVSDLSYRRTVNGIGSASFTVEDPTGAYIPTDEEVVTITIGGVVRWAGTIANPSGITWLGRVTGTTGQVQAQDQNQLLQRIVVNAMFASQTLEATLNELASNLFVPQAITIDAAQAPGDILTVLSAPWMTGEELIDYLSMQSSWVRNVSAAKALKMWPIGSVSSGVTLSIDNANVIDAGYDVTRYDYRSQQWVIFGPTGVLTVTDRWTGDGVTQEFAQHYPGAPATGGSTKANEIVVGGAPFPVGITDVDVMEWTWRESNHRYVHTGAAIADTVAISAVYDSQFPNSVFVQDDAEAATRPWVRRDFATHIQDYDEARARGLALIRQNLPRPQLPKISTLVDTINPGDTVVADFPEIGLSAVTCFVREIETQVIDVNGEVDLEHTLSLIGGTELPSGSPTDVWKRMVFGGASVGGGGTSGSGGAVSPSTQPSPVDYGGTMTKPISSGFTTPLNQPDARDIRGDGRTYVIDVLTRSQFPAHTATPSVARCSAAHVVEATVASGTGTNSTSSDPSTGNWQTIGPFLAEAGKYYRLQVTMNHVAGQGATMGVAHVA